MLEHKQNLGHLISIYAEMINHFGSQSQTCQLLKVFFFKHWKEIVKNSAISGWTYEDQLQIWRPHSLISSGCKTPLDGVSDFRPRAL